MRNKHNTYQEFQYDRYIGRSFLNVSKIRKNQFRIKRDCLVRNEDGLLGFCGYGWTWGLAYLTETGPYSFNPIRDETQIVWIPAHRAYVRKDELEHFQFPVVEGEFYKYENDQKFIGPSMFFDEEVPKLPKCYTRPLRECPSL